MFRCSSYLEMTFCYTILLILISSHTINASDDVEDSKQKRHYGGGVEGLFPFPRSGRSDPDLINWDNGPLNSLEEYEEYPSYNEIKRQGLIPFPRVGRSGRMDRHMTKAEAQELFKNLAPGSGGMWFGPRLGRVQKRSNNNNKNHIQGDHV